MSNNEFIEEWTGNAQSHKDKVIFSPPIKNPVKKIIINEPVSKLNWVNMISSNELYDKMSSEQKLKLWKEIKGEINKEVKKINKVKYNEKINKIISEKNDSDKEIIATIKDWNYESLNTIVEAHIVLQIEFAEITTSLTIAYNGDETDDMIDLEYFWECDGINIDLEEIYDSENCEILSSVFEDIGNELISIISISN